MYGFPEGNRKTQTWDLLRLLYNHNDNPWLVGDDLNEILSKTEKSGGNSKASRAIESFREAIGDRNLRDIKGRGSTFTWNSRRHNNCVWERLDRFLCNSYFDNLLENFSINRFNWMNYDHRPIEFIVFSNPFPRKV